MIGEKKEGERMREKKKGKKKRREKRKMILLLLEISLFNYTVIKMSTQTASFRILHGKISELSGSSHI